MKLTDIFLFLKRFKSGAAENTEAEAWAAQLQQRCDELTLRCKALDSEVVTLKRRLNIVRNRASAFQAAGLLLSPPVETTEDLKRLYETVAPWLDQGSRKLYQAADELSGFCRDGGSLYLDDDEISGHFNAYPGATEKEHGPRKVHGQTRSRPQNTDSPEYQAYERSLYRMVLQELGFQRFLSSS